jgi:hypothetical protein
LTSEPKLASALTAAWQSLSSSASDACVRSEFSLLAWPADSSEPLLPQPAIKDTEKPRPPAMSAALAKRIGSLTLERVPAAL